MAAASQTYVCDCLDCRHHWVSRAGFGTPDRCPKCQKARITCKPTK